MTLFPLVIVMLCCAIIMITLDSLLFEIKEREETTVKEILTLNTNKLVVIVVCFLLASISMITTTSS